MLTFPGLFWGVFFAEEVGVFREVLVFCSYWNVGNGNEEGILGPSPKH